ncbi:MAG: ferrous iron transport protein A [Thermomonas sp.]|nr:MAG: ferrous iron transport protein A [Thermomonas sp.]
MIAGTPCGRCNARIENNSYLQPIVTLNQLARRTPAIVEGVEDSAPNDAIARRLRELGFVAGEQVEVVAAGPFGAEPLLVQVGFTRFALRQVEAARVRLRTNGAGA